MSRSETSWPSLDGMWTCVGVCSNLVYTVVHISDIRVLSLRRIVDESCAYIRNERPEDLTHSYTGDTLNLEMLSALAKRKRNKRKARGNITAGQYSFTLSPPSLSLSLSLSLVSIFLSCLTVCVIFEFLLS